MNEKKFLIYCKLNNINKLLPELTVQNKMEIYKNKIELGKKKRKK